MIKPIFAPYISRICLFLIMACVYNGSAGQDNSIKIAKVGSSARSSTVKTGAKKSTASTVKKKTVTRKKYSSKPGTVIYGQASYYANMFNGRRTANGEIFSQQKFTAACNVLPLGTWIQVFNLKNGKSVIVKTTDRLHPRMNRVVDLSKIAAQRLGYIGNGLTRVKVIVLDQSQYPQRKKIAQSL